MTNHHIMVKYNEAITYFGEIIKRVIFFISSYKYINQQRTQKFFQGGAFSGGGGTLQVSKTNPISL